MPKYHNNKLTFLGASDSVIVQGLFYLVKYVLDNEYPKTIISEPLDFFDEIGLSSHLGPSRSNGLNSLKRQIKNLATELQKN